MGQAALSRVQEQQEYLAGLKLAQLSQLEYVIAEAMDGWRKSKQPLRQVAKVQRTGLPEPRSAKVTPLFPTNGMEQGNGQNQSVSEPGSPRSREDITTRVQEQAGDTSFLREARAAMSDIRDILGLNAPKVALPVVPGEGGEFEHLTDAEIDVRIAALLSAHSGMQVLDDEDPSADAESDELSDDEEDAA
jgi:hypothetical protein